MAGTHRTHSGNKAGSVEVLTVPRLQDIARLPAVPRHNQALVHRHWTENEKRIAMNLHMKGITYDAIGKLMNRTRKAVQHMVQRNQALH